MSKYFSGFILKLIQTTLSFLVLLIQTNSMNTFDFAAITLLYTFAFATSFLDFGVATRFIHDHFSQIQNKKIAFEDEIVILRKVFRTYQPTFIYISIFHSLLGVLFIGILEFLTTYHFSFYQFILFELSCFVISFSSLASKTFIALGQIDKLLRNQIFGVALQLILLMIFANKDVGVSTMIIVLCVPSIVIAERVITCYRLKYDSVRNLPRLVTFSNSLRTKLSAKVQVLQGIQYLGSVIFPVLAARRFSTNEFASYSVQFRLFYTLASILGTMNLLEWRTNFTQQETAIKKLTLGVGFMTGFMFACTLSILAYSMWGILGFNSKSRPEISSWILWSVFTGLQLTSWKLYYVILARQKYINLILAGTIQLVGSLGLLILPTTAHPVILPAALIFGLVLGISLMIYGLSSQNEEI